MKRRLVLVTAALIFAAMQFSMLGVMMGDAYPPVTGGDVECDTTLQMIPMTHTIGGGTIHWHITGDNARELRMLILDRLDNATINDIAPNDTGQGRRIGEIDESEIRAYVAAGDHSFLQNYIQGIRKMWIRVDNDTRTFEENPSGENYDTVMFQGVEITRASLSNNNIYQDTDGLIGQTADSNADIDIFMTISMKDTVRITDIDLSNPTILKAPFECLTMFDENGDVVDSVEYRGDGGMTHWTISIGFDSFYNPSVKTGTLYLIRTPAGEVYRYSTDVQDGGVMEEGMQHSDFNPIENPQILFIIMIVFGYLAVALPTHFYLKYRSRYPKRYRVEAKRIKWLHWLGRIFLLLMLLLYFWPMIGTFYFSGIMFIGMSIGLVALSAVLSKVTYERAEAAIPPEYFEEKKAIGKAQPAKKRKKTPTPPVAASYEPDKDKIHCIRCGALITIKEGENLLKVKCPVCGAVQKRVERGYNHLILDSSLKNTYNMLADFLRDGDVALCLSTSMPGKLKRTYHLSGKLKCIWLSAAGGKDTLDPSNIDKISETIDRFAEKYPASIILVDGLEYLVVEHGFDAVSRFLKKVMDTASMRDITLMVPINPASLSSDELTILKGEFDRVEALEDMDEREFF